MYVKCFETVFIRKCQFLTFSNFPLVPAPHVLYVPTLAGTRTQKTDAGIGQWRWPGMLQGTN
ncbi:unnamed protein product, partial [Staurois parvus]